MTTDIISLIPVLTFSLFVIIILALCVYKSRCCCKLKDAEHANTKRPDISTVYWDETRRNSVKKLRSRPDNVLQSRPARKNEETDNGKSHECVSISSSLGDERMVIPGSIRSSLGGNRRHGDERFIIVREPIPPPDGRDSIYDKGMKKSVAGLINAADDKPVVWAPPPPPPPPDPPNPNS